MPGQNNQLIMTKNFMETENLSKISLCIISLTPTIINYYELL